MASVRNENEDMVYRVYLTDMLRYIVHNTAVYGVDGEGRYKIEARYADLVHPEKKRKEKKKEQTSEDIIAHMKDKIFKLK